VGLDRLPPDDILRMEPLFNGPGNPMGLAILAILTISTIGLAHRYTKYLCTVPATTYHTGYWW
jgi:hypothetical protein